MRVLCVNDCVMVYGVVLFGLFVCAYVVCVRAMYCVMLYVCAVFLFVCGCVYGCVMCFLFKWCAVVCFFCDVLCLWV